MARPAVLLEDMEVEALACNTGGVAHDEWRVASEAVVQTRAANDRAWSTAYVSICNPNAPGSAAFRKSEAACPLAAS